MTGTRIYLCAALVLGLVACDNGRDRLLAELQSQRPEDRALAVKKLADLAKPEDPDLILFTRAAKDPASVVRSAAAEALGKSQDPRVVDLLGDLLGDPDESVQAQAAMALAEIKNEKAKAYLTLQYARRGRSTRQAIVQALKAANVPGAMASAVAAESKTLWDQNLKALTEGAPPERVAAAEELGKSGRAEAVSRLLPMVKESQVLLAAAAVRGLGFAGDHRAVPTITAALNENFPELREAACESLLRLKDAQALPKLKDVAEEKSVASPSATRAIIALPRSADTDKALCEVALQAASAEALQAGREMRKRGGCPLDPILEKLRHESASQQAALQAIEGLGPTAHDALPKVLPFLQSSEAPLRRTALLAISEIGDPSAADVVQKVFDQEVKTLGPLQARWVTDELPQQYAPGFDPSAQALPAAEDSEDSDSTDHAKELELFRRLKDLNDTRAQASGKTALQTRVPKEIIEDISESQRQGLAAAIRALGALKAPGALQTLKRYLDDDSSSVRTAAYVGLASLGPEGIASAAPGLFEQDRDVQSAVAQALAEQGEAGQQAVLDALLKMSADRLPLLSALDRVGASLTNVEPLKAIVKEGGAEAAVAARILGNSKAKDAVEVLIKYLDDPNGVARRDVIQALGRIGDPKASEVVARDLYNDSPDVRTAAAEALASIGSAAQAEPLDALKGDYYLRVRETAEQALAHLSPNPETSR